MIDILTGKFIELHKTFSLLNVIRLTIKFNENFFINEKH